MSVPSGRNALLFVLATAAAISCGGGSAKEKNQQGVGPWCGAPKATQFDVLYLMNAMY